jgi:hypothetical protein
MFELPGGIEFDVSNDDVDGVSAGTPQPLASNNNVREYGRSGCSPRLSPG